MSEVRCSVERGVAIIGLEGQPTDESRAALRTNFADGLAGASKSDDVDAIVITAFDKLFVDGNPRPESKASRIETARYVRELQRIIGEGKPVAAALQANAIGSAFELALACHLRVAMPGTAVGLPDIQLGLLPGGGGIQLLTRLVGPDIAADWMVGGKVVAVATANEMGAIDEISEDPVGRARTSLRDAIDAGRVLTPMQERPSPCSGLEVASFDQLRAKVARKARGARAPLAIVDCIEAACTREARDGQDYEEKRYREFIASDEHIAMSYYLQAERDARDGLGQNVGNARPIRSAGVIGSGTMGGGIAMVFANAGIPVKVVDISFEALGRGLGVIRANYETSVARGSMTQSKADASIALIEGTTNYEDLATVDIAIEAVFEKMELKRDIFARLDAVMKTDAILATNTSSLDIDRIADATNRPSSVVGVHFFSPANIMKLQENVRGTATSPDLIASVMSLGTRLGKVPVLAGNCDGFIGNRMLQYYQGEAEFMLEQGAGIEQIDRVAERFGMPMGPLAISDLAGIDVGVLIYRDRAKTLSRGDRLSPIPERLLDMGRLGQKNGKGYYRYEGRQRIVDAEVTAEIEAVSRELGIERRTFTDEEIEARLFMPLVNEGAKELEDGTAIRPGDIDVVWVNGYGFPAYKGGPMFWGEAIGLNRVLDMAEQLALRNGPRWGPSDLLRRLVAEGKGFSAG